MSAEEKSPAAKLLRLHVATQADPSILPRLLGYFQNLNVTPRKVLAEFGARDLMHLTVDICGLAEEPLSRIAGKIGQAVPVEHVHWHYL